MVLCMCYFLYDEQTRFLVHRVVVQSTCSVYPTPAFVPSVTAAAVFYKSISNLSNKYSLLACTTSDITTSIRKVAEPSVLSMGLAEPAAASSSYKQ